MIPPNALRHAAALHNVKALRLESRWGSALLQGGLAANAHSLYEFQGNRFAGVAATLLRDGVNIQSGLGGNRLAFAVAQTIDSQRDFLFVAGGGAVLAASTKLNTDAEFDTLWIAQTSGDPVADQNLRRNNGRINAAIEDTEDLTALAANDAGALGFGGVAFDGNDVFYTDTDADESFVVRLDGNISAVVLDSEDVFATAPHATGVSTDDGGNTLIHDASAEAFIQLQGKLSGTVLQNVDTTDSVAIPTRFRGISYDAVNDEVYAAEIAADFAYRLSGLFSTIVVDSQDYSATTAANLQGIGYDGDTFLVDQIGDILVRFDGQLTAVEGDNEDVSATAETSGPIGIEPTGAIFRLGSATVLPAQQIKVDSDGNVTRWGIAPPITELSAVQGSAGPLNGVYQYRYTYRNSVSGHRSDPSPISTVNLVDEGADLVISADDVSSDAQVDQIEIWRTVGNGSAFFLVTRVTNAAQDVADGVADTALSDELELPDDNGPPGTTLQDVVGPHQGRLWWSRDTTAGLQNRVFYSPIGRPESVGGGTIDIQADDDAVQKLVIFGGALFVFTLQGVFQVMNDDEPFVLRRIALAPGTIAPFAIASTDAGIFYLAHDGVRIFNGIESRVISGGIERLLRGEAIDDYPAFEPTVAAFARGEYICSDQTRTFALNVRTFTWREVGIAHNAYYWELDNDILQAATLDSRILSHEQEGQLTDAGAAIAFDVEPAHVRGEGQEIFVRRLIIDCFTDGEVLSASIITNGVAAAIGNFNTAARQNVELPVHQGCHALGLRLTGNLSKRVFIYGIQADIHVGSQRES